MSILIPNKGIKQQISRHHTSRCFHLGWRQPSQRKKNPFYTKISIDACDSVLTTTILRLSFSIR
ncbi:hypothetical protein BRN02_20870 [Xanthomonas oryzae pv. oryzae]|nr:hypothetical protein BRN69_18770 [Xanthomonas oryzae pv. oryzae]RBB33182.1 hypothetical protein BRN64_20680 [Xanthomonas oryzae pv. oryzae]RBC19422.1 hypothetical protein BRN26_21640 [Xanthomonas oryzae pv. oryzae]RBC28857.1 hypothetical protein BRM89_24840 [Xanthomonas oryzae pv. oryzae]RBC60636.1 hypothetical protein BRN15_12975 [Xanthomonas oryzae pv. oryzae]